MMKRSIHMPALNHNCHTINFLWIFMFLCFHESFCMPVLTCRLRLTTLICFAFIFGLLMLNLLVEHFFFLKIIEKLQCVSYLGACDVWLNIMLLLLIVAFVKKVLYQICQLQLQNFSSLPCLHTRPLFYALVVFLKKCA